MSTDLATTLTITVVGLVVVGGVLVVLSYAFMAMKLLSRIGQTKPEDDLAPVVDADLAPSGDDLDVADEDELVAAIMAALAAYMGDAHVVTSIRRVEDATAWSRTGRHVQMASAL